MEGRVHDLSRLTEQATTCSPIHAAAQGIFILDFWGVREFLCLAQIAGSVSEALEIVKEDYPDVDVAQPKYGYSTGENDKANTDFAWAILNHPHFPVVDALINHDGLMTSWELLHSDIDIDEDYTRLSSEKGWDSRIDPRHMGLIQEPVIDPNMAGSSAGVLADPPQTGGRLVLPVVLAPGVPPPNVIAHHCQPLEDGRRLGAPSTY